MLINKLLTVDFLRLPLALKCKEPMKRSKELDEVKINSLQYKDAKMVPKVASNLSIIQLFVKGNIPFVKRIIHGSSMISDSSRKKPP